MAATSTSALSQENELAIKLASADLVGHLISAMDARISSDHDVQLLVDIVHTRNVLISSQLSTITLLRAPPPY